VRFLILLLLCLPAAADIVHMTDGRKLEGKVLQQEAQKIQLKMRFGTVWLLRKNIDRVEAKPLSWKTKPPKKKDPALQVDINSAHRIVFHLTRKYQSHAIRGWWDFALHEQLMKELASPTLRNSAFRIVPSLLPQIPNSSYPKIYRDYLRYGNKELKFWYARGWSAARKLRLTKETRKPSISKMHSVLTRWLGSHPEYKFPNKYPKVALLLKRQTFLQDYERRLEMYKDPKVCAAKLVEDGDFYQRWLFVNFGPRSNPKSIVRQMVKSASSPRLWMTDFQLTDEGLKRLKASLLIIEQRLKKEAVDDDAVLFDAQGFGTKKFRLLLKTDGHRPHLFRLHRYYHGEQLVVQHLILRLVKPLTHMLIRGKAVWYAPVLR